MAKNPHAVILGRRGGKIGGKSTSAAKIAAVQVNGLAGGRPPMEGTPDFVTGYKAGYQAGYKAGKRGSVRKVKP